MKNDIKKIVAIAIATGGLVAGGFIATNREDCPYEVEYKNEKYCFTEEEKQIIENGLKPNAGFGGVKFNQK